MMPSYASHCINTGSTKKPIENLGFFSSWNFYTQVSLLKQGLKVELLSLVLLYTEMEVMLVYLILLYFPTLIL